MSTKKYFGFIYKWTDKKRNMYYIGSHYGQSNDSYVCSSKRMLQAFNLRPADFSRIILEYVDVDNQSFLLGREQTHLDAVPNIKNHPDYYNIKDEAQGGWSFITNDHITKRANTLKEQHAKDGLSDSEKKSYKTKIQTRLSRIKNIGFTTSETNQHNSYGYTCKVILPSGKEQIFNSLAKATKTTGIDCQYARNVTLQGRTYKNHSVYIIAEPTTDCRSFKNE